MVISQKERTELTVAAKSHQLAQQKLEFENAKLVTIMLGLYDKYKVNKNEFSLDLASGAFVKIEKK